MNHPQIIGRDRELATLNGHIQDAATGHGRVVLLAGEAGLGKTLLARHAFAQHAVPVCAARARLDVVTPYGPVAAVLRTRLRAGHVTHGRDPALSPYLALLLPELGPGPADATPEVLVEAILDALLADADEAMRIVLLEDLQWADNATLELLPLLAERIADRHMLILGTYRSDEMPRGHPLRHIRQELRRAHQLHEVIVEPLSRADTGRLLSALVGNPASDAFVALVHRLTQGVPLYVEELAAALQSSHRLHTDADGRVSLSGEDVPVPESVRDAVLLRLDALSELARRTIEVAALVGLEFPLELVAALAESEDGVEELLQHHLVEEGETGYGRFHHALIREVIRNEIAWSQRRSLSRRIATYLDRQGAPPEQVAEHWLTARELEPACRALLEVADRSCQLHAYRDAAAAGHRALENWPESFEETRRVDTLRRLAHCAQVAGQLGDAVRALREAATSIVVVRDAAQAAEIQRDLATLYGLQGSRDKAFAAHRDAATAFERIDRPADACTECLAVAGAQTAASSLEAALETLQHAEVLARTAARQDLVVRCRGFSGNILAMQGRFEAGRQLAQEALSLALASGSNDAAAEAYRRLASVLDYGSDFAGARDAYATAVDYCRTQGDAPNMTSCLGCMSAIVYRTGEWKRALDIAREISGSPDTPVGSRSIGMMVSGLVQALRGEMRAARRTLESALSIVQGQDIAIVELYSRFGLGLLSELTDERDAAARAYDAVLEGWRATEDHHDLVPVFLWQSTFFSRTGSETATTQRAEVLAQMASGTGNRETIAALAHALGEVALVASDAHKAVEHFANAQREAESLEIPLERAVTSWRYGVALARAGRRQEAITTLHAAWRLLRRLGARPVAELVRQELSALGEPVEEGRSPDAAATRRRGGLTRRQVEIVQLLAEGFTNKEIAARLFVSTRTVDMHVRNILDRLDCAGRTEAARKAAALGLLGDDRNPP